MKLIIRSLLCGLVIVMTMAALGGAYASYWIYNEFNHEGPLTQNMLYTIPKGAHIGTVATSLYDQGIIDNPFVFKAMAKINEQAELIKAGEYELTPHMSMKTILDKLVSGHVFTRQVTVREGLTNYEINRLLLSQEDLEKKVPDKKCLEGHLLPETYSYQLGDSTADIMERMASALDKVLDEAWNKRANNLPFKTKEDALILASIIEKETAIQSERRRVAGVFINRLRNDIMLQSDPTVIYALTMGEHDNGGNGPLGRRLLKKDLEFDSPYNTYKYSGLPPTPIANPGKASIEAALNPEKHEFLYFVADGSGGHAFAKSLAEHNDNVTKWRKIRQEQE